MPLVENDTLAISPKFTDLPISEQFVLWAARIWVTSNQNAPTLHLNLRNGFRATHMDDGYLILDRIMTLLSEGGTHITYGAMAKRPLKVPNSFLIFKDLRIQGLWLSKWLNSTNRKVMETVYGKLAEMMIHENLHQPIDSIFRPEEIKSAIERSMETGRDGKVLLDFTS